MKTMRAAVIEQFGGPETLAVLDIPMPEIGGEDVLIRVAYAGIGEWDAFEREGGYAEMLGIEAQFPYVLGSEGAGTVAAVGANVRGRQVGERVYAQGFLNPKGGFYAEYVAVPASFVSPIPAHLNMQQASVISGVGLTALRGLEDVLHLQPGETILIFGASGGVGHLAAQMARHMGARVLAVASGEDGVGMVRELGIETVIDGRKENVLEAARSFAPGGLDAVLLTAGGEAAEKALQGLRAGGRAAHPIGISPEPQAMPGITIRGYHGEPDTDITSRLHRFLEFGALNVHVDRVFPLEQAADAHRAVIQHYLGKLALKVREEEQR